jgi:hypothetical protein
MTLRAVTIGYRVEVGVPLSQIGLDEQAILIDLVRIVCLNSLPGSI